MPIKHLSFGIVFFLSYHFSFAQKKSKVSPAEQVKQWIEQGEAEWEVSNYQDAIHWFNKAIKLDSLNPETYFKRAKSWVYLKKYENALKDLLLADSMGYKSTEYHLYIGVSWFGLKDFSKALYHLEKFEELAPKDTLQAPLYVYLAECYTNLDRKKDALKAYQKAIQIKPDDAEIYFSRANFWVNAEHWKEALNDIQQVLTLNPRFWKAYKLKAEIFFRQGKDKESIEAWNRYFSKTPNKKDISALEYSLYAHSLANLKQYNKAIEALHKAISLEKDNPELYYERAEYYIAQKNYLQAVEDISRALQLDSADLTYLRKRAFLYYQLKKYEDALTDYILLTQQEEKSAENYYKIAELKFLLKRPVSEFQQDLLTAFQLGYPKEKMLPELQVYAEKKLGKPRGKRFLGIF